MGETNRSVCSCKSSDDEVTHTTLTPRLFMRVQPTNVRSVHKFNGDMTGKRQYSIQGSVPVNVINFNNII
jgi:hypothetical protein